MWIKANPNPKGKIGTDCVIRAISICLKIDWYEAFDRLCAVAREDCDMPSNDGVWGAFSLCLRTGAVPASEMPGVRYA